MVTEWRNPDNWPEGRRMKKEVIEAQIHQHLKSHTREEQSRYFSIEEGRV
ncbi:hypothetical protein Mbo2_047 [Rhodococcus phage Mbo2]|uniref:Uncharacterized protein n=1 Tax=Rhodococcus phage Mbo2 TaxID=2936911 RepID=A0A9E7ILP1_9CAUD|nr:hypothetical protein Mbo2_047 [Rhodococcus phage Mbo2]